MPTNHQTSLQLILVFITIIQILSKRPAELIAKYIDSKLRVSKGTDAELEQTLDTTLSLFRFI